MSYAPATTYLDQGGDGSIIGSFYHKETDVFFEYSTNTEDMTTSWEFPHKIWVLNGTAFRYARVLKTVAYIAVDEDDTGRPVVEKWNIKQNRVYPRS